MLNRIALGSALALLGAHHIVSYAEVPDEWLTSPEAEIFGAPPTMGNLKLSPNGTHVVFTQQAPAGFEILRTLNLADGSVTGIFAGAGSESGHAILWCDFVGEERILCDVREGIPFSSTLEYQKFFSFNLDGSDLEEYPRNTACAVNNPWTNKPPFDRIEDEDNEFMFVCGNNAQVLSASSSRVRDTSGGGQVGNIQTLYPNGHGLGSIYSGRTDDDVRWFFRDEPSMNAWQQFARRERIAFETPFRPAGFGTQLDQAFNFSWDEESSTWSLFRQSMTEPFENRLIFSHGEVDIEVVDTMGRYDRVVSVAFLDGRAQRAIVDRRVGEVFQFVEDLFAVQTDTPINIEVVDESWDQNIYLVKIRAPRTAGQYLLVNMDSEGVQSLGYEYDHMAGFLLAETQLVQYQGSDGGMVTAHLTLPQTYSGPVPAVVIPRSRPSHEELADPHYLVEYLAAKGYAVLRVQNRVDEAYGSGWIPQRSVVGWSQSADDIADGARFLAESNISPADSICAAGKNYGVYSAYMTAVKHPDVFACLISIAGMTDPRLTPSADVVRRNVSGLTGDLLDIASPIDRARDMALPTLMFHGENDWDFPMDSHTVTLFNALDSAHGSARFIEYPYGDHQIRRAPYRIDMLTRIGQFLEQQIGPGASYLDALAGTPGDEAAAPPQ